MFLEKIELYGFKSFLNRTAIPLSRGVTAIVGPNGCGKSNVSDAFRWVIGESNVRNLRGERVQDVIFKGTRSAKAMGMAEVTLTVHNDEGLLPVEYTQLGIGRRIFRSGDSEFLLNKTQVRLKDIRNLLTGTGLGSHGYAVIERSMIDDVLTEKDETRRFLFEEAAGIVRYKQRRREAQRKLEGVEGDLIRIEDMIREIEREVRSLARQAGKVRRWRTFKEELDRLAVRDALEIWQELFDRSQSSEAGHRQKEARREDLQTAIATLEAQREAERQNLIQLNDEVDRHQHELQDAVQAVSKSHEEMSVLTTRNEEWARQENDFRSRLAKDRTRLDEIEQESSDLGPRMTELEQVLSRSRNKAEQSKATRTEAESALRELRAELHGAQQTNLDLLSSHSETRKDLEGHQGRRIESQNRLESLDTHLSAFAERETKCQHELAQLDLRSAELEKRLESLQDDRAQQKAERDEIAARRAVLAGRRGELQEQKARLESKFSLLEEQKANHEGFDAAVRWVLERRDELEGVVGVVGEEIRLRETKETVGQAVLGDSVGWILVRDEASAIDLIGRLREEGLGGITLFPLAEAGADPAEGDSEVIELFDSSDIGRPFLGYLGLRARVATSIDDARSGDPGFTGRRATLDGLLFSEGAVHMTGGQTQESEILSRGQEIPILASGIATAEEELREVLAEDEQRRTREREVGEALEATESGIRDCEQERSSTGQTGSSLRTELTMLLEERTRLQNEHSDLKRGIQSLDEEVARLKGAVTRSGDDSNQAQSRFEELRELAEAAEELKDQRVRESTELEMEAVRHEKDHAELLSLRDRLSREQTEKRDSITEIERLLSTRLQEAEEAEVRISALETGLGELQETRRAAEKGLGEIRDQHATSQTTIAEFETQIKTLRTEHDEVVQTLHKEDVERVSAEAEAEQVRKRIQSEYGVDLAEWTAEEGFPEPEPEPEVEVEGETDASASGEPEEGEPVAESASEPEVPKDPNAIEEFEDDEDDAPARPAPRLAVIKLTEEDAALPPEERRDRIKELRRKIEAMGSLNYLAEEEYETQKERLDFHSQQASDLHKARGDLLEAIRQINETAGEMFRETFEKVQELFVQTFVKLFPGGEASLRLEGTDPLEGDILIAARPRGKRLESVRLLSTGERSLTAIALLFSLYMIKPSPVCLLDEVDAPLDDANLDRFLEMISELSARTQFIMITHNKKTMKVAQNLFGVTMEQPGISKIVSVRLNGADVVGANADEFANGNGSAGTSDASADA